MDKIKDPGLGDLGKQLRSDVEQLGDAVEKRGSELRDAAFSFVHEHPYAAVGAAFGVGYLLSGALFSRTSLKLAGIGGRFLAGMLLKQVIAGGGLGFVASEMQNLGSDPSAER